MIEEVPKQSLIQYHVRYLYSKDTDFFRTAEAERLEMRNERV